MMNQDVFQAFTDSIKPKFAISYLRVSTKGQAERGSGYDEGFSIPAQREANKRKAISMGAIVGKEFVDRGASAKSQERPELQKMLKYIKENASRVDYVIVHKVDRLARNRGDDADITRTLKECGVQLISASEAIDETPSGMLLHGIMSSIAEFFSQNLATEVRKGMSEKVRNGGTVSRAPLGYINVRRKDAKGRRDSTVILDEERAPLIKLAFEEYATGEWSYGSLAEHLAGLGLTTLATPKSPSKPVTRKTVEGMLSNPYYRGVVVYGGVEYEGRHPAIISAELWNRVCSVRASHRNSERTREHPHFLKGSLYCQSCGSRIIITYSRNHAGVVYPYFICGGRHSKRVKGCRQKAVLICDIEERVGEIYSKYTITPSVLNCVKMNAEKEIKHQHEAFTSQQDFLEEERKELEQKRRKLLEAHYADAIPLDLLKEEQEKISDRLAEIEREVRMHNETFENIAGNLDKVLEILEGCDTTYRLASDHIKRIMNQTIFGKMYIEADGRVTAALGEPFQTVLQYVAFMRTANHQISEGYEDVLSVAFCKNNPDSTTRNLRGNCLSNALLVHLVGTEWNSIVSDIYRIKGITNILYTNSTYIPR